MPEQRPNVISGTEEALPPHYPQPGPLRDFYLTGKTGRLRTILTLLCVAVAYFAASKATVLWIEGIPQATLLWLPAGIGLAAVLLCGYRVISAIFIGSFLANMPENHQILVSTGIALGHTVSLPLSIWVMRRFFAFDNDIKRLKDILVMILCPVLLGSALNAAIGVTSIRLAGHLPEVSPGFLWMHWWLGNINGMLFLTPLLLVFLNRRLTFPEAFWRESVPLMLCLALLCTAIFGPLPREEVAGRFLIFPLVTMAAYRFGQYGTTCTLLITMVAATWWLPNDIGVLGINAEDPLLQIFMAALAMTGLFLGAAISERQDLEQRLRQYTQALERSNQELDDFTYIVSHDLKEPLRGLKSFSRFLLEDYADRLDEEGKNKLRVISNLAFRLDTLLDTLLYYSRLGRSEMAVSETNLEELVRNVVEMLSISLKEKNVTVEIQGNLPVIKCNPIRIQEVFQNLIGNAIKYNDRAENKIEIGFVTNHPLKPGETVFYVRDHGIGIPEKYLKTVFNMFKRLHPKEAYGGGTGSGLAIVRKIITQNGGDIWAESKGAGQGTTFFFTIPQ